MCTVSEFMYLFYFIIVKICNLTVRQINLYTIFSKYHNGTKVFIIQIQIFQQKNSEVVQKDHNQSIN